jgi:hypothetical protein
MMTIGISIARFRTPTNYEAEVAFVFRTSVLILHELMNNEVRYEGGTCTGVIYLSFSISLCSVLLFGERKQICHVSCQGTAYSVYYRGILGHGKH